MEQAIKCMHCHTPTKIIYKTVKSKSHDLIIYINNVPMHYCPKCDDSLISLEAIEAFNYIRELPLKEKNNYDYNIIKNQIQMLKRAN